LTPPADATKQERARAVAARARLLLGPARSRIAGWRAQRRRRDTLIFPVCGRRAREGGRGGVGVGGKSTSIALQVWE